MKVALIYDRVNKYGGAERVMETLLKIFPSSPLYTLVSSPKANWVKQDRVRPTFLNSFFFLRNKHELLAPIAPLAFETHDLSEFDLVISVTSSDAKSVLTKPGQTHICLCLTPTRYLWKGSKNYKGNWKMRLLPRFLFSYFRQVDLLTSMRPDHYLSISKEIQNRVKKYYSRDSQVIYPPLNNFFLKTSQAFEKKDFYLVAGRLVRYKRIDLAVKAFNKLGKKLVIVGSGSEEKYLKTIAKSNITFRGQVSDQELLMAYGQAKALVFPGLEDFGLVPLEAQAQGTPVIAYGAGGAKETVIKNKTGVFFKRQSANSLLQAIQKFERQKFNPVDCVRNAQSFSEDHFKKKFLDYLRSLKLKVA